MVNSENIGDFYKRVPQANPYGLSLNNTGSGHFNVFSRENCSIVTPYRRRDFYKVTLLIGQGRLFFADRWILIDKPALLFSNPLIPYSWEGESQGQLGWFCLFSEAFLTPSERLGSLHESALFKIGGDPVFFVNEEQQNEISVIFLKMMQEMKSDYTHKYDVLRNLLQLLIHEAMKINPIDNYQRHHNAAERITSLFIELLERQFPIDSPGSYLKIKTPKDYALHLSVHVNHLNRAVKEFTGKTTTEHIATRLITEAWALLKHSNWNISEIAYSLGFEYPPYFTNFFKKKTGISPNEARKTFV
ncbi:helix-turn-helix transcriptional regulator [Pedobacter antarcticus]|uniref:helix-turn-helix domain-containing protein n=1 Tax=Pedobacter antarcticus TaxID=34086 RepID=UPI00292D476C|nr:helix-turn-helix transcriptional regulator [Pedobacter antarcticus]